MEQPTFNEASLRHITEIRPKINKEIFNRNQALAQCPDSMKDTFQNLFDRIDILDYKIQLYEFIHNMRAEEPKQSELISKEKAINSISKWNQFTYLKQRHAIVEMRREQFTLKDFYTSIITRKSAPEPELNEPISLDAEIPIYPLGLCTSKIGTLIYKNNINPNMYTQEQLQLILKFYWNKQNEKRPQIYFDFENVEHLYELFNQLEDIELDLIASPNNFELRGLIETLKFYISQADLNDIQKDILDMKIQKKRNQDIADYINQQYKKSYTINYISTIFKQKILKKISEAVYIHKITVENLPYNENFKKCCGCGSILLLTPELFVRKSKSGTGFSARCKRCDRDTRNRRAKK